MRDLTKWSLEELANDTSEPGSMNDNRVNLELERRQTIAQLEATKAVKDTAEHSKRNSDYMLYSVIVLAAASVAQLVVSCLRP
jgi:hypothetical protein